MSPLAKKIAAAAYALGLVTAAVAYVLFMAWLAPKPAPPPPRQAPIEYRFNELHPHPAAKRESWERYAARMRSEGKEPIR